MPNDGTVTVSLPRRKAGGLLVRRDGLFCFLLVGREYVGWRLLISLA